MKQHMQITKETVLKSYRPIDKFTHKGIQGHALIIGGSHGKIGSICLSTKAALMSGCGLVTAVVPECGYQILQVAVPEVMVADSKGDRYLTKIEYAVAPQAIGIGPGMGQERATVRAFHEFLQQNKTALVADADALNILSKNAKWMNLLPSKTILTPHYRELERMIGIWDSEPEKMKRLHTLSKEYDCIVVVKGAPTLVVYQDAVYENTTGNAALATAGSGDVLTGIITSLLAQGYEPLEAAQMGVYLHGMTADLALPETGYQSFIASDTIKNIGKAWLSLTSL